MHHKNIKAIIKKQLKKKYPHWRSLTRKEKRSIATMVADEAVKGYDFKKTIQTPLEELWCLVSAPVEDLPGCYGSIHLERYRDENRCCLLPDGHNLLMISSHERWIFLRFFCLDEQHFKRIAILRTPLALGFINTNIADGFIWLIGDEGNILKLELETLKIKW